MSKPQPSNKPKLYGKLSFSCTLEQKRRIELFAQARGKSTSQWLNENVEKLLDIMSSQEEEGKS